MDGHNYAQVKITIRWRFLKKKSIESFSFKFLNQTWNTSFLPWLHGMQLSLFLSQLDSEVEVETKILNQRDYRLLIFKTKILIWYLQNYSTNENM